MREVDGQNTKYHLHCLRHTFAVRRYLQTRDIYLVKQELGHSSVVTTEIYAKFSLRRSETDFPSLINSTKNTEIWESGHRFHGYNSSVYSVSYILSGNTTNRRLLWEQEIGSSNLSTPTLRATYVSRHKSLVKTMRLFCFICYHN